MVSGTGTSLAPPSYEKNVSNILIFINGNRSAYEHFNA
jgi:hypothetical protein